MRRRLGCVFALAALAGCSSAGPVTTRPIAVPSPAPALDRFAPVADLAPEQLMEPVVGNRTLALAQRAAQTTPFCLMMAQLDELNEPEPADADGSLRYAQAYYNVIFALDPRSKIDDPAAAVGTPRKVLLPPAIVAAAAVVRSEVYAYLVRVRYAQQSRDAGTADARAVRARLADAFVRLATSDHADAGRTLADLRVRVCRGA